MGQPIAGSNPALSASTGRHPRHHATALHPRAYKGKVSDPSSDSGQDGLCAISQGCPSGSATYPEYPPQSVASGALSTLAPAATARATASSTASRDTWFWASAMPPQPPPSAIRASVASLSRSHSASTIPFSWKNATSPSTDADDGIQPSP